MPAVVLQSNVISGRVYWLEQCGRLWVIMAKQGRKKANVALDIYYLHEKEACRTMERLAEGTITA